MLRMLAAMLLAVWMSGVAFGVEPDEVLPDQALESRARALSAELRCLVCQNQSIDESDAPLAKDLRVLIRERLAAGDSDAAVLKFMVDRYGEFVLLRPAFGPKTLVLWLLPFGLLLAGLAFLLLRRRDAVRQLADLSPEERQRAEELAKGE